MTSPQRHTASAGPIVRVRLRATIAAIGLALACGSRLSAGDRAVARDVGDWTVAASKDGKGCFVTREYAATGGTTLLLGLDIDGTNRLTILNANWSIKPRDRLKLNFRLSNSSYPAHFAVGIASEGKQGFVTSFGAKFPSYFATSGTLDIARGDVPVARLRLDRGDAAIAELGKCVDDQRARPAGTAAGKAHADDIPSDPFAPASARKAKK